MSDNLSVPAATATLSEYRGLSDYRVEVHGDGTVVVTSPEPGRSFTCAVRDLPYLLLCEVQRGDELFSEVFRLRGLLDG